MKKIYVDLDRDRCTIWTDDDEVFSMDRRYNNIPDIAWKIKNLVTYKYIKLDGERETIQDISVAVDRMLEGACLIDCLKNIGVKAEPIKPASSNTKSRLERQEVVYEVKIDNSSYSTIPNKL